MMMRILFAAAIAATPAAVVAQDGGQPPQRIRSVTLQPGEKCPESTANEVVVCGLADQEQFRIPKALRDEPKTDVESVSQVVKMDRVMQDTRRTLPGSCSAVGTAGQTGCAQAAAQAWSAEKRATATGQSLTPND